MKKFLVIMAAMFCGAAGASAAQYPSDIINTAEGYELKITFFGHGSIAFEYRGKHIYIDPVSDFADYSKLPEAFAIFVTHEHGDHLDAKAIKALSNRKTLIYGNETAIEALGHGKVLDYNSELAIPFDMKDPGNAIMTHNYLSVRAFPAYNISTEKLNFHPKDRKHNGYILTFGGTRVYVAGDTEDTPDMLDRGFWDTRNIDIVFLPVNLPYTMTEEQAARAVRAIQPKIFYPYHYGQVEHRTDLDKLKKLLEGSGVEVRIRPLE